MSRFLTTTAAFVIVVAGMRAAGTLVVPFLLAVFIAILCTPLLFWLQRKGVPNALAVICVLVLIMFMSVILGTVVGSSVNDFAKSLPLYQARLNEKTAAVVSWAHRFDIDVSEQLIRGYFDPGKAMKMAGRLLTGVSGVLTNAFMIMLTVIFILLEASGFPKKLASALKNPAESRARLAAVTGSINRYLAIKTFFSLITGTALCLWLVVLGVDYPVLWGLLAFMLNYVPNIGSIIAAVPAVLLSLIQLGPSSALLTCGGYVVVNITVGSLIEPRFMGRGLGLSTLVVFTSLVFWGWVLGPVGMLLSVPLTMIVKIALESNEDTRWIGLLLGSGPALGPSSTAHLEGCTAVTHDTTGGA